MSLIKPNATDAEQLRLQQGIAAGESLLRYFSELLPLATPLAILQLAINDAKDYKVRKVTHGKKLKQKAVLENTQAIDDALQQAVQEVWHLIETQCADAEKVLLHAQAVNNKYNQGLFQPYPEFQQQILHFNTALGAMRQALSDIQTKPSHLSDFSPLHARFEVIAQRLPVLKARGEAINKNERYIWSLMRSLQGRRRMDSLKGHHVRYTPLTQVEIHLLFIGEFTNSIERLIKHVQNDRYDHLMLDEDKQAFIEHLQEVYSSRHASIRSLMNRLTVVPNYHEDKQLCKDLLRLVRFCLEPFHRQLRVELEHAQRMLQQVQVSQYANDPQVKLEIAWLESTCHKAEALYDELGMNTKLECIATKKFHVRQACQSLQAARDWAEYHSSEEPISDEDKSTSKTKTIPATSKKKIQRVHSAKPLKKQPHNTAQSIQAVKHRQIPVKGSVSASRLSQTTGQKEILANHQTVKPQKKPFILWRICHRLMRWLLSCGRLIKAFFVTEKQQPASSTVRYRHAVNDSAYQDTKPVVLAQASADQHGDVVGSQRSATVDRSSPHLSESPEHEQSPCV